MNIPEIAKNLKNGKEQLALSICGLIMVGIVYAVYAIVMWRLGSELNKILTGMVAVAVIVGTISAVKAVIILVKCRAEQKKLSRK